MNRMVLFLSGLSLLLAPHASAYEHENSLNSDDFENVIYDESLEAEGRFFFGNYSTGQYVTFNSTVLLFSSGIILWGIAGALTLYYFLTVPESTGYSDYSSGYDQTGYDSGYSKRRSFDPFAFDWEKLSGLDMLEMAIETYKKFDPSDLECQKRLICELHQNTEKLGRFGRKMVDGLSWLEVAEVLSLPSELKHLVREYLDAADRGKTLKQDCGNIYSSCDFSLVSLTKRVLHSNEV